MSEQVLLIENRPPVRILTLQRPEARNALNSKLIQELERAIDEVRFTEDLRVLVITGAGDKAFCAGADLKERLAMSDDEVRRFLSTIRRLFTKIEELPLPVLAAINGVSLGGGTELALACDLRVAVDYATMGLTETRLAIIPGAGGTQRLPRLVGIALAKELIYGEISKAGPIALAQAKFAINRGKDAELHTGLAIEASAYEACIPTEDRIEGLKAFKEKRKPVYKGR
jgi:enoyl-CoA hydratase/carnithine racemase